MLSNLRSKLHQCSSFCLPALPGTVSHGVECGLLGDLQHRKRNIYPFSEHLPAVMDRNYTKHLGHTGPNKTQFSLREPALQSYKGSKCPDSETVRLSRTNLQGDLGRSKVQGVSKNPNNVGMWRKAVLAGKVGWGPACGDGTSQEGNGRHFWLVSFIALEHCGAFKNVT